MSRVDDGARGSIVIEALVAVLIIAAIAGALFETVTARAREARGLTDRRLALLVAQSHLAAFDLRASEVPGRQDGAEGEFVWRLRADRFQDDQASDAGMLALVDVAVVRAGDRRPLAELRSLRFVR